MRRSVLFAVFFGALVVAACTHDFDVFDVSGKLGADAGSAAGGQGNPDGAASDSGGRSAASGGGSSSGGASPTAGGSNAGGAPDAGSSGGVDGGPTSSGGATDAGGTDASSPCDATQKLCGASCVAKDSIATGCGAASCDACALTNATAHACTAGQCFPTGCASGFGNCNGTAGDGCEHDVSSDPLLCNDCGRPCSADHVENRACSAGKCSSSCDPGRANCNRPTSGADDGCEVDATIDAENCGGCGNDCTAQTSKVCVNSLCGCTADAQCRSGQQQGTTSCDTAANLCHCNAATCKRGESCRQGNCSCNGGAACGDGTTCCRSPSGCKNLQTDPASCGACGRACAPGFACAGGACQCDGDDDCNGGAAGTCSGGVCHCGASTCATGERCLPNGQCG